MFVQFGTVVGRVRVGDDLAGVVALAQGASDELVEVELLGPGDLDDAIHWRADGDVRERAGHVVGGHGLDEHVRQAQTVAKLLLSDVREVVSQLREGDAIDLSAALKTLVDGVPGLTIHLDLPPRFAVDDPLRAQVMLRCAQEIITNTVKHAGAANLLLRCERTEANELAIHARDDGRGAAGFRQGNGLTGMRERLAQVGGRLNIDTQLDRGFALDAWLPLEAAR